MHGMGGRRDLVPLDTCKLDYSQFLLWEIDLADSISKGSSSHMGLRIGYNIVRLTGGWG